MLEDTKKVRSLASCIILHTDSLHVQGITNDTKYGLL